MANEKYANAKCFVFSPDGYLEITYAELCRRREEDITYRTKKFLPLHGMLMEVTPEEYRAFYKACRRQKYLTERSVENGDISIDMLTTDAFNGEDILSDKSDSVVDQVVHRVTLEELDWCLSLLEKEEQELLRLHFYQNISQRELGLIYDVNQSTISRKIQEILTKLKNLMKI